MRTFVLLLALLAASPAGAAEFVSASKIDAVTVFSRGAEILRIARLEVPKGAHTVVLSDLPARTDLNSIRVEGKATGSLEIGSVDARRVQVRHDDSAARDSRRRELEDAIEAENDRLAALQADIESKQIQKRYIENLAGLPTVAPSPGRDQAGKQQDWVQLLSLIGAGLADVQKAILAKKVNVRGVERKIEDLKKELAGLAARRQRRTEVKINVVAGDELTADLLVRYQVPNANWRPYYDARLETGSRNAPSKLVLVRRAAIAQRTGEAWTDVVVSLSTARPSARSGAPSIRPLTVNFVAERSPVPIARMEAAQDRARKQRRPARPQAARSAPAAGIGTLSMATRERGAQVETAGYQALFKVPERISVANTGDAKRVKIESIALEPSLVVRSVPKFGARAYLYAKLTLPKGTAPILHGQVVLFRDQTFVGKGTLPQLAGGEAHELGFGADDAVRIKYTKIGETRGESGLISSSRTDQRKFKISIKNLHERPIAYSILDQRPESLNEDIKVELVGRTKPTKHNVKDKRGVVAWEGRLAPDQEREIDFGYVVRWPADKKIRYRR